MSSVFLPAGRLRALPRVVHALTLLTLASAACGRLGTASGGDLDHLSLMAALEEARIGSFDNPDLGFSRINEVEVDRDGNVYVLEGSVPEIRVFSPTGTLLRRIGRRGAGPGEFEWPQFGLQGDTLWVVDGRLNRITLFDREGTLLSTGTIAQVQVPLPKSFGYMLPRVLRPDGRFMSAMGRVASSRNDPPTGVQPTDSIPVPLVLFHPSGAVADTAGWAPRPPPRMWRPPAEDDVPFASVTVDGRRFMVPSPPTTLPQWLTVPDGYVAVETPLARTADEGVLRVTRFGVAGDTVFSQALRYTPSRYRDADLDSIAARAARGAAGGMVPMVMMAGGGPPPPDDPDAVARRLREAMSFPEFQLPVEIAWLAQDESIWLRRPEGNNPSAEWVVLDPEGHPRGRLELPSDLRVVWNRGDTFWAVDLDEYDVPWLVRYRMEPA